MSFTKRSRVLVGVGLVVLLALGLRCGHPGDGNSARVRPLPTPDAVDDSPVALAESQPMPKETSPRQLRPQERSIVSGLRASDAADLDLLARIERQTGKSPSAAVLKLVSLHQQGAGRQQLQAVVEQEVELDMRIQIGVRRWLRLVAPDASDPSAVATKGLPASDGPRVVSPLRKRSGATSERVAADGVEK